MDEHKQQPCKRKVDNDEPGVKKARVEDNSDDPAQQLDDGPDGISSVRCCPVTSFASQPAPPPAASPSTQAQCAISALVRALAGSNAAGAVEQLLELSQNADTAMAILKQPNAVSALAASTEDTDQRIAQQAAAALASLAHAASSSGLELPMHPIAALLSCLSSSSAVVADEAAASIAALAGCSHGLSAIADQRAALAAFARSACAESCVPAQASTATALVRIAAEQLVVLVGRCDWQQAADAACVLATLAPAPPGASYIIQMPGAIAAVVTLLSRECERAARHAARLLYGVAKTPGGVNALLQQPGAFAALSDAAKQLDTGAAFASAAVLTEYALASMNAGADAMANHTSVLSAIIDGLNGVPSAAALGIMTAQQLAKALYVVAGSPAGADSIQQLGGLDALTVCLDQPDPELAEWAAVTIGQIADKPSRRSACVQQPGLLQALIQAVSHSCVALAAAAAGALRSIAGDACGADAIIQQGGVVPLACCLGSGTADVADAALSVIKALAAGPDPKARISTILEQGPDLASALAQRVGREPAPGAYGMEVFGSTPQAALFRAAINAVVCEHQQQGSLLELRRGLQQDTQNLQEAIIGAAQQLGGHAARQLQLEEHNRQLQHELALSRQEVARLTTQLVQKDQAQLPHAAMEESSNGS